MKKFLILFLALTFVFSFVAFAAADDKGAGVADNGSFTMSGDMRVRGISKTGYDFTDTANATSSNDTDDKYWDQRLRLKITGMVGDGIEVRTRINVGMDELEAAGVQNDAITLDYSYIHIPVGNFVVDAGVKTRNWGNKLVLWDAEFEGVEVTTDVGDTMIGLYTDKVNETRATAGTENLEDYDNYGIFAVHNTDNMTAGLHFIKQKDDRLAADTSGTIISAYLNTSVGAVSIAAEIAQRSGDINTAVNTNNSKQQAGFIYAATDVGAINVNFFAAMLKNGFVADNDLAPTVFFGAAHPLAISNVMAAADSTTKAFALGAGTDVSSDLSVYTKLAYFDLENTSPVFIAANGGTAPTKASDESATEIDLGLAYKLSANATYYVDFGYLMPDSITLADDEAIALGHKIQVLF